MDQFLSLPPILFIRKVKYDHFSMRNGQTEMKGKDFLKQQTLAICKKSKTRKKIDKYSNRVKCKMY